MALIQIGPDVTGLEEQISEVHADLGTQLLNVHSAIQSIRGISLDVTTGQIGIRLDRLYGVVKDIQQRQNEEFLILKNLLVQQDIKLTAQDKKLDEIKRLATIRRRRKAAVEEEEIVAQEPTDDGYDRLVKAAVKHGITDSVHSVNVAYAKKMAEEETRVVLPTNNLQLLPNSGTQPMLGTQVVTITPEK